MPSFRVLWEIDIEAGTAQQAAKQARAIQLDPESTATVFDVRRFGPCPSCKCHVAHKPRCRYAAEGLVDAMKSIDVATLTGAR